MVSLEERLNYVSRDEYERAYGYLQGEESAKQTVAELFRRVESDPNEDVVLDPKFIALLALFCESGRKLAAALLSQGELGLLQWQLAQEFPRVRIAFPHLTLSKETT